MEIKMMNVLAAMLICMASCSDDDERIGPNGPELDGETTAVKFEMNAEAGNYSSLISRSVHLPAITKENFRILAFKRSPANGNYLYLQDIPIDQMDYSDNILSGTVRLPIGEYKFIPTYGLVQAGGFTMASFTPSATVLDNTLNITHDRVDGSSVFFLDKGPLENLQSYSLGINPTTNETVSLSIGRAVSRVDLLFLQVTKNADNTYTEVSNNADVFGPADLASVEMQFTDLNKNVNLVGKKITTDANSLFDMNFQVPDLGNTVTRGTSTENTKVGTKEFLSYDNITSDDIKLGSAHVHGAYLLPFDEMANTTGLNLVLRNSLGDQRIIHVNGPVPLERNKVTLIKIYVLRGTVFNTDVKFQVIIDTAWLEANSVEGEIN